MVPPTRTKYHRFPKQNITIIFINSSKWASGTLTLHAPIISFEIYCAHHIKANKYYSSWFHLMFLILFNLSMTPNLLLVSKSNMFYTILVVMFIWISANHYLSVIYVLVWLCCYFNHTPTSHTHACLPKK